MIDIETKILTHDGCMVVGKIGNDTKVFGHHDDLHDAQIGTQAVGKAYRVVLSDESTVTVDKDHIFGGLSVKDLMKNASLSYEIPQPELVDFFVNTKVDYQVGSNLIFDMDRTHLPHEVLYGNLESRQHAFEGMKVGFRDIDGAHIATIFNATYAQDIANLCRSLGHDATVYYTYKGIKYWNIVIRRGPRKIVGIESVGKRQMVEIPNVVTQNYIAI